MRDYTRRVATLKQLRQLALALPGAEEYTSYGTPAFRVRKKLFARLLPEGDAVVVKVDLGDRDLLVEGDPDKFAVTPHYQNYPMVIVRFGRLTRAELRDVLTEAWRYTAPPRLVAEFEA